MSKLISFTIGIISGIYIAQNYKIPKLGIVISYISDTIAEYEKKK
jgi:hypothetical protein